jgi:hypothetical protein
MPFSRAMPKLIAGDALGAAMRSIGLRVGSAGPIASKAEPADIEVTLASTAASALPQDYRLLGVLMAWLQEHHGRVHVPRLGRIIQRSGAGPLVRAFWAAVGMWLGASDARWRTFERLHRGKPLDLDDSETTTLQLLRLGPDTRFAGSALRVHAKLLRSRPADVDTATQLAARHPLYRKRLELGANYRADVWAALDRDPEATPAQIARRVGCAYETARSVAEDWRTLRDTPAAA